MSALVLLGIPFPRGRLFQTLTIDDHIVMYLARLNAPLGDPRPDLEILRKGRIAYQSVGLRWSEKKATRGVEEFEVLGAAKSREEILSAPPLRAVAICELTVQVVELGLGDLELLQSSAGRVRPSPRRKTTAWSCDTAAMTPAALCMDVRNSAENY